MQEIPTESGLTLLAVFELGSAEMSLFEQYEGAVLPLLSEFGARLQRRVRSIDQKIEMHLVWFPSQESYQAFREDPRRKEHGHLFQASNVTASVYEVTDMS